MYKLTETSSLIIIIIIIIIKDKTQLFEKLNYSSPSPGLQI